MRKAENSIGMFNFVYGLAMIAIIVHHVIGWYDLSDMPPTLWGGLAGVVYLLGNASCIPVFFMANGYNFKVFSTHKIIKKNMTHLLQPILYVCLITSTVFFATHYICFRYFKGAVQATIQVALGILFAFPSNYMIGNFTIYNCGAVWFLAALFVGNTLLHFIESTIPVKWIPYVVTLTVIVGYLSGLPGCQFFSIPQGMIAVGYIYIGSILKKKELLFHKWNYKDTILCIGSAIGIIMVAHLTGKMECYAYHVWALGPVSLILDGVLAFYGLYFFNYVRNLPCRLVQIISSVGQYSFWLCCLNCVIEKSLPWYLFAAHFKKIPVLGCIMQTLICVFLSYAGVILIKKIRRIERRIKHIKYAKKNTEVA